MVFFPRLWQTDALTNHRLGKPRLFLRLVRTVKHMQETAVSADEVINALRRYVEQTGDTQRTAAVKMGVNRHTLCRWLTEKQIPKKIDLVLVAVFLKRERFL